MSAAIVTYTAQVKAPYEIRLGALIRLVKDKASTPAPNAERQKRIMHAVLLTHRVIHRQPVFQST